MRTIISELPNRSNFLKGMHTVKIGYPWLTYGAIIALERSVMRNHNVLELGSGGSTIFFSKRCNTVKSYETDPAWVERVKEQLNSNNNVTFVCGDADALLHAITKEPDEYYDWLLVDISNSFRFRLKMTKLGVAKLKKRGMMIVDNYGSRFINRFDYTGWDVYTFDDLSSYVGRGTRICIKL